MKYAIVSDIHSNLEALTVIMERINKLAVDRILNLGDIVGYNANPNECIDVVVKNQMTSIMGNHDAVASGLEEPDKFNYIAREAVLWTRDKLTPSNKEFLKSLPCEEMIDNEFIIVHGSLIHRDHYIISQKDIVENFKILEKRASTTKLCFFGHTHIKICFRKNGNLIYDEYENPLYIDSQYSWLINPGSVGQPRDADSKAAFAVYDSGARLVYFYREEYDIEKCYRKIVDNGLPIKLGERLFRGW